MPLLQRRSRQRQQPCSRAQRSVHADQAPTCLRCCATDPGRVLIISCRACGGCRWRNDRAPAAPTVRPSSKLPYPPANSGRRGDAVRSPAVRDALSSPAVADMTRDALRVLLECELGFSVARRHCLSRLHGCCEREPEMPAAPRLPSEPSAQHGELPMQAGAGGSSTNRRKFANE